MKYDWFSLDDKDGALEFLESAKMNGMCGYIISAFDSWEVRTWKA